MSNNHHELVTASYLVDEFETDVKQRRYAYNHFATKSMTRLTVLMLIAFMAIAVQVFSNLSY